jgi:hypothetical protein
MQPLPCTAATTNLVPLASSRILTDSVNVGVIDVPAAISLPAPDRPL